MVTKQAITEGSVIFILYGEALGRRRFPLGWVIRCVVWRSVAALVSELLYVNAILILYGVEGR